MLIDIRYYILHTYFYNMSNQTFSSAFCPEGVHVALPRPHSASGHSGNIPWPDYFHVHVWERGVQSDLWSDFRNHLEVRRRPLALAAASGPRCLVTLTLHSVPLLSITKIPLWRWQRMLLFMLGNLICCIVTSVLLNLVDHRQVLHPAHQWFYGVNANELILISYFFIYICIYI